MCPGRPQTPKRRPHSGRVARRHRARHETGVHVLQTRHDKSSVSGAIASFSSASRGLDEEQRGGPLNVYAARLSPSTCRNHRSSWFQLAKMRVTKISSAL